MARPCNFDVGYFKPLLTCAGTLVRNQVHLGLQQESAWGERMATTSERAKLIARARDALKVEASTESKKRTDENLECLCVELLCEWIVGDRRFENQTQQGEYWLSRIYEELYADEQPDATKVYARFGFNLPRSQYLTRLLLARRPSKWRSTAREELRRTLKRVENKAKQALKDGQEQTQRFDLSLSRGAYDELVVVYDFLAAAVTEQDRPTPPTKKPSSPTLVWFSITAETVLEVLNSLSGGGKRAS